MVAQRGKLPGFSLGQVLSGWGEVVGVWKIPAELCSCQGRRGGCHYMFYFSSSILMRRDLRNLRSWSLILNSGLVERVVTREVLSEDFSPCLLTPMVASRTRKMS